ncbi:MAG: radical SAM protein [Bacteroidales bacterium]|jgi:radical SAM superfamily enzyme YgiQ (UPF0313 family)|nr:radical SAM protein [Bacteroidales bacterium]
MKKVLLINSNTEILPYPVAPLGISLVASSICGEYNVEIFDFSFESTESLIQFAKNYNPDFIGISLRNIDNVTMRSCTWYLKEIKLNIVNPIKKNFDVPVIIGGSGFSIAPEQVFNYFDVDYGVVGEAEEIFLRLLINIDKGKNKNLDLENVITKQNKILKRKDRKKGFLLIPKANIDHFINFEPYKNRGSYPIQTKRGCSHKCIYCSYPNIEGKEYRLRPVSDIVDEIEEVRTRIPGVNFEFVDSTFNSPLKHAVNICKEIICRDLKVNLRTMGVNPGEVTDELVNLMKQAGFTQIDCTPDSASELMIKNYRKNFNKNKLIQCSEIIRKYDMPTMWFFMIGGPGETEATILETFEFIDSFISEEDLVHLTEGIRIIPDTELYVIAIKEGVISKDTSVIEPMFYTSPSIGEENLTNILEREIGKRNNVMNSIDTAPSPELMQATIKYRIENKIDEPMFRSLLRVQKRILNG